MALRWSLSPAWFWIGAGATAAAGGVTIASAVDTANLHSRFDAQPSAQLSAEGADAQLRTNVLVGVTTAVLLTTALVGGVFVKWGDR